MGLYVEVMCDVRADASTPDFRHFCWSDRNDNPQGGTPKEARAEARRQGWKLGRGRAAVCPNCATLTTPPAKEHRHDD
jgi:hypothetical protein